MSNCHLEAADASLELLLRRAAGVVPEFFRVESMRVITDELKGGEFTTEATVQVWVGSGDDAERRVWVAEGSGPVNAIDSALRKAVGTVLPAMCATRVNASTKWRRTCWCAAASHMDVKAATCSRSLP